ncbi:MAG: hypothetical protein LBK99_13315 [Opitutaceae bacterium]|jgi:hypothetical protein|nr:hypothetical protein [Opitutaceae bacterium]
MRITSFAVFIIFLPLLQATPDWQTNPSSLGNASLDGGLALALPMGPVPAAPEFGLSLQLVHDAAKVKTTEHAQYARRNLMRKQAGVALLPSKEPLKKGEADPKTTIYRSGWNIPQLVSYLFPANRDRLLWQRRAEARSSFCATTWRRHRPGSHPKAGIARRSPLATTG